MVEVVRENYLMKDAVAEEFKYLNLEAHCLQSTRYLTKWLATLHMSKIMAGMGKALHELI